MALVSFVAAMTKPMEGVELDQVAIQVKAEKNSAILMDTGDIASPAYYLIVMALVSFVAAIKTKPMEGVELDQVGNSS